MATDEELRAIYLVPNSGEFRMEDALRAVYNAGLDRARAIASELLDGWGWAPEAGDVAAAIEAEKGQS